ncbi:unnamed protein product [Acanthoscelides obtectus]|uniref:Uncharacterized protein n=1 Tax=Acanthoscelides obtectus TaxID=200917 RepID=A0A9P0QHN5_ACAOB|nr:unnamed protein product [Acanthoscelides obtectus]CAK1683677.1 hypothetical protein AOBTE_LOCUS34403 [Acanthoscelides obtectus]
MGPRVESDDNGPACQTSDPRSANGGGLLFREERSCTNAPTATSCFERLLLPDTFIPVFDMAVFTLHLAIVALCVVFVNCQDATTLAPQTSPQEAADAPAAADAEAAADAPAPETSPQPEPTNRSVPKDVVVPEQVSFSSSRSIAFSSTLLNSK